MPSYRRVEYRVLQGVGPNVWKWSVLFDAAHTVGGDAATRASAIVSAERAIDRRLGSTKLATPLQPDQ
jgi:hypothetical protein